MWESGFLKKVLIVLVLVIALIGGVIFGSLYVYHGNANNPLTATSEPLTVNVNEGESLYPVVDRLAGEGIIKNGFLTKFYYRLSGLNLSIEPGRHEIPAGATLKEMLDALASENLDNVKVTLPEGFTIENMAQRMEESGLLKKQEFIKAVEDFTPPDYVPAKGERRYRMEGYLMPNTYVFTQGTPAESIVQKLSSEFTFNFKRLLAENDQGDLDPALYDDIVNKAAMIERETNNAEERSLVASVIENRLAIDMKLQLDATILYALGVDSKVVTFKDMAIEDPYSTYYVQGLPLGPICNPSSNSIKAVLEPASTNYIYYLLNPQTGKHFFTDSYDEFLEKKKQFNGGGEVTTIPSGPETTTPASTKPENPYQGPSGLPFEILPEQDPIQENPADEPAAETPAETPTETTETPITPSTEATKPSTTATP